MNATNRAVNRVILGVVGLVLLLLGGAGVTASLWPAAAEVWQAILAKLTDWLVAAHETTRISASLTVSWLAVTLFACFVLIIVMSVIVTARLGGGRSGVVLREDAGEEPRGSIIVRQGFAAEAMSAALSERDEILSSRVITRRLRDTDVLQVSLTPRQHASPVELAETSARLIDNLAVLTGKNTPALVSIRSGIRSRLAASRPRVE